MKIPDVVAASLCLMFLVILESISEAPAILSGIPRKNEHKRPILLSPLQSEIWL